MGTSPAAPSSHLVPHLCYTIWFSQRVGSTWFSELVAATGIAGRPAEYLNMPAGDVFKHYGASTAAELLERLFARGTTANGVFGMKFGYSETMFGDMLERIAPSNGGTSARLRRWENAFPNHRHILMTRRNKLRLAVSWWRAIKSGEWHRRTGQRAEPPDLERDLDAVAIDTLMQQAVAREAGVQELFSEAGVIPLDIAYEDAIQDPLRSVNRVLTHLGLPLQGVLPSGLDLEKTADELTEQWVQRFRKDRQDGWTNRAW